MNPIGNTRALLLRLGSDGAVLWERYFQGILQYKRWRMVVSPELLQSTHKGGLGW